MIIINVYIINKYTKFLRLWSAYYYYNYAIIHLFDIII